MNRIDGAPLLAVEGLQKRYRQGRLSRAISFTLAADFRVDRPCTIGVLGPNGSGKTTLFELITGSNVPSAGRVKIAGQDIHRVRYRERDRLAVHYHQSYQVRKIKRTLPSFLLQAASRATPLVSLFDEPQFSIQDGLGLVLLRKCGIKVGWISARPSDDFRRSPPSSSIWSSSRW